MQLPAWYTRRILLVGTFCFVLLIGLLVLVNSLRSDNQPTDETARIVEQSPANKQAERVFIKDFNEYHDRIDVQTQHWIEDKMYTYVSQDRPDLYTGVVRPGSYSTRAASNGLLNTELLIDVEPSRVTYKTTVVANPKTDYLSVEVVCAPKAQQVDPSAVCRDGGSNE